RRLDHRRARRGQRQIQVHDEDVHPGGPGHHAAAPLRVRPGGAVQPGEDLPDPAAVRRGPRAAPRRAPPGRIGTGGAVLSPVSVPRALARACGAVRPGGRRDAVAGLTPPWVASPADVAEASALLAAAT